MCGGISLVGDVMSLVVESFFFRRIILGARLVGGAVDGLFVTVSLLILMYWYRSSVFNRLCQPLNLAVASKIEYEQLCEQYIETKNSSNAATRR